MKAPNQEQKEQKQDLRAELARLEVMINELKIQYEQYFSGVIQIPPDRLHNDLKMFLRKMLKSPFRSSAVNFKLKALETRYQSFNTYWQRTLKQKEDGTYSRDVFKAELRERNQQEEVKAQTKEGKAENSMQSLFNSYKTELEKISGSKQNLDFNAFKNSLIARAKEFKEQHGAKKLTFKVQVKDGKVSIKASGTN